MLHVFTFSGHRINRIWSWPCWDWEIGRACICFEKGNWKQKQACKAPHGSAPGANIRHIDVAEPLLSVKCQRRDLQDQGWVHVQGCIVHADLLTSWKGKQKVPDWFAREAGCFGLRYWCRYKWRVIDVDAVLDVTVYMHILCCFYEFFFFRELWIFFWD